MSYTKHSYHCKICGKPGSVSISDDYVGDKAQLLTMAVCNACGDFRTKRLRLEEFIGDRCMELHQDKVSGIDREKIQAGLKIALGKYATNISHLTKMAAVDTSHALKALMQSPDRYYLTLRDYRDACLALVPK